MSVGQKAAFEILELQRTITKLTKTDDLQAKLLGDFGFAYISSLDYFRINLIGKFKRKSPRSKVNSQL